MAKKARHNMTEIKYQWGDKVNLASYHDDIYGFQIDVNKEVKAILIERFGLADIAYLHFEAEIKRQKGKGNDYIINLFIKGEVVQFCVISGEKLPEYIEDSVKIRVLPLCDGEHEQYHIDEDIEYHYQHIIDMSELLIQNFAILLSPFPRIDNSHKKSDVVYSDEEQFQQQHADNKQSNPFAALAKLKT